MNNLHKRAFGDFQLYEWEIEGHINFSWAEDLYRYSCEHMHNLKTGKYELHYMRLTNQQSGAKIAEKIEMCCDCYQKLRNLGLAPLAGTWE